MKFLIPIIAMTLLSCTLNMNKDIVSAKKKNGKHCYYETQHGYSGFRAPCNCYEIGDSVNKYIRYYQKNK